ncbi:fibronectin type III domain-containing protein [Cohnella sp. GCM10020058]|uniref:fibronectin type III domain-containing protein n=1 Tax=Cohnella sp. GCM10020058 TaxID=3317330 RepID=UPI00362DCDC3
MILNRKAIDKRWAVLIVLAMLASLLAPLGRHVAHATAPNDNLLVDPGFESGNWYNWGFFNNSFSTISVQSAVKRSGNYAFKAVLNGNAELQYFNNNTPAVTPGTNYYFEVWMKTDSLTPTGQASSYYPGMKISAYNNNTFVSQPGGIQYGTSNQDWTKLSGSFASPAGANKLLFLIGRFNTAGSVAGTVYYDDAFLAKQPDSITLTPSGSGTAPGTLNLSTIAAAAVYSGSPTAVAASDPHLEWSVQSGSATISGGQVAYTGTAYGGQVTLKASYLGRDATVNVTFNPNDSTAPTWTSGAVNETYPTPSTLHLAWSGASDNIAVTNYKVYVNGRVEQTVQTASADLTVTPGTSYRIKIEAGDQANQWSTNGPSKDLTAPTVPSVWTVDKGMSASSTDAGVVLNWSAAAVPADVTQYKIYQNGTQVTTAANTRTFMLLNGLTPSTTYVYKVEATTAAGTSTDGPSVTIKTRSPAENMSNNGGMDYDGSWNRNLGSIAVSAQSQVKHGGTGAFKFAFTGTDAFLGYDQYLPVNPGDTYYYDFWVKTDQLTDQNTSASNKPNVSLQQFIVGQQYPVITQVASNLPATQDWTQYKGTLAINPNAYEVRVLIERRTLGTGTVSGTLYVDDFTFTRAPTAITLTPSTSTYSVGQSVSLADALNVGASYAGSLSGTVPSTGPIAWQVTSGSATVTNGKLVYTGAATGGTVTVQATYGLKTATANIQFQPESVAPTWPSGAAIKTDAKGTGTLKLSWPAATDNVSGITYEVKVNGTSQGLQAGTSIALTGLTTGTTYAITVRAKDASGNYTSSDLTASIATSSSQDPIWSASGELHVVAGSVTSSGATLAWSGATDDAAVTQYKITGTSASGQTVTFTTGAVSTYAVTGLQYNTVYTFKIEAGDAGGRWTIGGPAASLTTAKPASLAASLAVHETQTIRAATNQLLGYNTDWLSSQDMLIDSTTSTTVKQAFYDLMQGVPAGLMRVAGTDSMAMRWKYTIGTLEERTAFPSVYGGNTGKQRYGIMEWLNSTKTLDANRKITWTFNMLKETAMDQADLAEFLTGDGVHDPNGGTNWAQKRIDLGHTDPVQIATYELGNELDQSSRFPINTYIQKSKDIIREVKRVDPNAKFAALAVTGPWGSKYGGPTGNWRDWHNAILAQMGNDIDYITFHPYYYGLPPSEIEKYLNSLRDDIAAWESSSANLNPAHHIQIYISEHGVWPLGDGEPANYATYAYRTHDLNGTLGVAEFINRMYKRPEVSLMALHVLVGSPWGVLNEATGDTLYATGLRDLMKVEGESLGANVVQTSISGDLTNPDNASSTISVNAMTTASGGINLVIVNRDPDIERPLSLTFDGGSYKLVKKTVLTADTLESTDTATSRPITVTTTNETGTSAITSYTVPKKSMVVLHLQHL